MRNNLKRFHLYRLLGFTCWILFLCRLIPKSSHAYAVNPVPKAQVSPTEQANQRVRQVFDSIRVFRAYALRHRIDPDPKRPLLKYGSACKPSRPDQVMIEALSFLDDFDDPPAPPKHDIPDTWSSKGDETANDLSGDGGGVPADTHDDAGASSNVDGGDALPGDDVPEGPPPREDDQPAWPKDNGGVWSSRDDETEAWLNPPLAEPDDCMKSSILELNNPIYTSALECDEIKRVCICLVRFPQENGEADPSGKCLSAEGLLCNDDGDCRGDGYLKCSERGVEGGRSGPGSRKFNALGEQYEYSDEEDANEERYCTKIGGRGRGIGGTGNSRPNGDPSEDEPGESGSEGGSSGGDNYLILLVLIGHTFYFLGF